MFNIIDKTSYNKAQKVNLFSIYRHGPNEWRGTTKEGGFVCVKYNKGILAMSVSETEYELGAKVMLLAVYSKTPIKDKKTKLGKPFEFLDDDINIDEKAPRTVLFSEIMSFLKWECDENQIWDVCVG